MKFISSLLLLFSLGYATEYRPWFSPPWVFQGEIGYWYENVDKVQSPNGSFRAPTNNSSLHAALGVTPWPNWNVEAELYLTRTSDIAFSYEAAQLTIRYAWMDDIAGDWISLVTGATFSFPAEKFLHQFSFDYHGTANVEFHATVGKEWACLDDWIFRCWMLGGIGVANHGSPWLHGLATLEYHLLPCLEAGLFSEAIYGMGNNDIIPNQPFPGYASINHQSVDIGAFVQYPIRYCGTLRLLGWYNVHARNFIENYWGINLSLLFPFAIF